MREVVRILRRLQAIRVGTMGFAGTAAQTIRVGTVSFAGTAAQAIRVGTVSFAGTAAQAIRVGTLSFAGTTAQTVLTSIPPDLEGTLGDLKIQKLFSTTTRLDKTRPVATQF